MSCYLTELLIFSRTIVELISGCNSIVTIPVVQKYVPFVSIMTRTFRSGRRTSNKTVGCVLHVGHHPSIDIRKQISLKLSVFSRLSWKKVETFKIWVNVPSL